ncbi:hypothetical protein Bca52824_086202 [Brassica carinata]|uniref:F-box domain-containing protein n=1 Tax=Brassica carinata TaxID=52824 RepID=A0A8X7P5S6_BRACI|nr:hypothetical protein Bca52824_086202 [Brassica carinata]
MTTVKLPWDMEVELLTWLPPRSLVRFRAVCKKWNSLLNDKSFLNQHSSRSRPQFIFLTKSKTYSIDVDLGGAGVGPTIKMCEVASDFPCQPMNWENINVASCDGLLFREFLRKGVAVWNPWLKHMGLIEFKEKDFYFGGVGYDSNRPEKGYQILGYFCRVDDTCKKGYDKFAVYECAAKTFKCIDSPFRKWSLWSAITEAAAPLSLKGNLFWIGYCNEIRESTIQSFSFSRGIFIKKFCMLPCEKVFYVNKLVLAIYKGDRLSLLNQRYATGKIEIWVTKDKIDDRAQVVWENLMNLSTTNLPRLKDEYYGVRYFIIDKTIIMCYENSQTGAACVYIVSGDMFKKIPIDYGNVLECYHRVYFPNLIRLPLEFRRSLEI